ncbi:hypothetical protein B9Z19DRAFT_1120403 [Tuber borchii]|uniref:Uncharacterized protein n=1 Tax=Tuber borchii TaxID=42251 RepID=A0A2T7A4H4_TUBBO|nr:hypothetical protein B9Z19DRAFT_1120403 [Tuber borchii]
MITGHASTPLPSTKGGDEVEPTVNTNNTTKMTATSITPSILPQSSILRVIGWHRSNFLDFFYEHKIYFHPDWSWKTFVLTIAKFIVQNSEDEIISADWAKVPGGEPMMVIKFSSSAACSRGFEVLCKSKGFASCRIELRCS